MKKKDLSKLKGDVKLAMLRWIDGKINSMLPNQPVLKAILKRGSENVMRNYDVQLNKWMDMAFILFGDGQEVDSSMMIDLLLDAFDETKPIQHVTSVGSFTVGGGEIIIQLPNNMFTNLLFSGADTVKFTREDFAEIKEFLNV